MATLCTGNSYDLSQCSSANSSNNEYLYVKLTDSALRAIEEYQKNQNGVSPTIQFSGNEGILLFPTANGCEQKFSFQIQEIDLQGPQGSFECVQQNSQKQLNTLGTLPYKMRIQANDDVYESTKHKMAKETENSKNKCTREIKPNQTDIGRKVKLKPGASRYQNIPTNSLHQQQKRDTYSSSSNNNFNSLSSSTTLGNGNNVPTAAATNNNLSSNHLNNISNVNNINSNSHHHYLNSAMAPSSAGPLSSSSSSSSVTSSSVATTTAVTTTTPLSSSINNNNKSIGTTQQQYHHNPNTISSATSNNHLNSSSNKNNVISSGNGLVPSRVTTTNQHTSSRNQNRSNSAIMKRSLRERLIHLLALRPYKKPELYAKITSDGIKEKDKNQVAFVLKQITYNNNNSYHLHRHIWNDVQEDWPFYNEQDRQTLKRRKPQNLTPPLSSDGSSASGQSPTSTHNGSPPPTVKRPPSKIDTIHCDGPVSKKQRISHYKKTDVVNHDTIRRGFHDSRDASNMNPRSREVHHDDMRSNYYGSNVTPNAQESEDSGLSLTYSVLTKDAAQRISSTSELSQGHIQMGRDFNDTENNDIVGDEQNEFRDFGRITTVEQRRRYKTEFDNDFQEYRELHEKIGEVTEKFRDLQKELRNEEHNDSRAREIQRKILCEYGTIKTQRFQEIRQRFQYLHRKLRYIKELVQDFDTSVTRAAQENY